MKDSSSWKKKGSNCCQLDVIATWPPPLKDKSYNSSGYVGLQSY